MPFKLIIVLGTFSTTIGIIMMIVNCRSQYKYYIHSCFWLFIGLLLWNWMAHASRREYSWYTIKKLEIAQVTSDGKVQQVITNEDNASLQNAMQQNFFIQVDKQDIYRFTVHRRGSLGVDFHQHKKNVHYSIINKVKYAKKKSQTFIPKMWK